MQFRGWDLTDTRASNNILFLLVGGAEDGSDATHVEVTVGHSLCLYTYGIL